MPTTLPLGHSRAARTWGAIAVALLLAGRGAAQAEQSPDSAGIRPAHIWTTDYLKLLLSDTGATVTAPVRWNEDQWLGAGLAISAVGASTAFDDTIRDHVQAQRTTGEDRFMKVWQNLGSAGSFGVLAVFDICGETGGNVRAKNTAMDGLTSSIIAAGLIDTTLKYSVGRYRPNQTTRTYRFAPFSGHDSFASGHATQAFSVATAIAENYPAWWVQGLCYGSAALVGYARIEQNAHYTSDVVAGSLLGWSVARGIVHRHGKPADPRKLSWTPYANGDGAGLMFFKSF
jgi:hypothetical protein